MRGNGILWQDNIIVQIFKGFRDRVFFYVEVIYRLDGFYFLLVSYMFFFKVLENCFESRELIFLSYVKILWNKVR